MSKNPSERKRMPGEGEDLNRDMQKGSQGQQDQQGQQGQKKQGGQDWNKDQQKQHRQGEPLGQGQQGQQGQQGKNMDPNKDRKPGGSENEEKTDDRTKRTA